MLLATRVVPWDWQVTPAWRPAVPSTGGHCLTTLGSQRGNAPLRPAPSQLPNGTRRSTRKQTGGSAVRVGIGGPWVSS
jgi:hypothetical protein